MRQRDDALSKRMEMVELRLLDVEKTTKVVVADQDAMRRSLAEHEEWMRSLDTKLESARAAVDVLKSEVQAMSMPRLAGFGFVLGCIFILLVVLIR